VSFAFWFVNALDKERETDMVIPINITDVPPNVLIKSQSATELRIRIKDKGIRLLSYSSEQVEALSFEMPKSLSENGTIGISPAQISGKLREMFRQSTEIIGAKQDSIFISYQKLASKTVPVELVSQITLKNQFVLKDKIIFSPASVKIFGPKAILDTIKSVKTKTLTLKEVGKAITRKCELVPLQSVKTDAVHVKVTVEVEQFTEKKMTVPIRVKNCPKNVNVKVFPASAELYFNVGISRYNSVNQEDISVELDYAKINKNVINQKLTIGTNLSYISNIRAVPGEVEYIIEMK
jgi:hypothetical protein